MNSTEVCKIIKACRDNQVSVFEYAGLVLSFDKPKNSNYTAVDHLLQYPVEQTGKIGNNDIEHYEFNEDEEIMDRDLEELKIADPLEYEKILHNGER